MKKRNTVPTTLENPSLEDSNRLAEGNVKRATRRLAIDATLAVASAGTAGFEAIEDGVSIKSLLFLGAAALLGKDARRAYRQRKAAKESREKVSNLETVSALEAEITETPLAAAEGRFQAEAFTEALGATEGAQKVGKHTVIIPADNLKHLPKQDS